MKESSAQRTPQVTILCKLRKLPWSTFSNLLIVFSKKKGASSSIRSKIALSGLKYSWVETNLITLEQFLTLYIRILILKTIRMRICISSNSFCSSRPALIEEWHILYYVGRNKRKYINIRPFLWFAYTCFLSEYLWERNNQYQIEILFVVLNIQTFLITKV